MKENHCKEKQPEKQMVSTDFDSNFHDRICWCPVVLAVCAAQGVTGMEKKLCQSL